MSDNRAYVTLLDTVETRTGSFTHLAVVGAMFTLCEARIDRVTSLRPATPQMAVSTCLRCCSKRNKMRKSNAR